MCHLLSYGHKCEMRIRITNPDLRNLLTVNMLFSRLRGKRAGPGLRCSSHIRQGFVLLTSDSVRFVVFLTVTINKNRVLLILV